MRLLLTFSLFCISLTCFAQEQIFYFKKNGKKVDLKDSADYIRVVQPPDSNVVFFTVIEFYKNGKLKLTAESIKDYPFTFQGEKTTYFENGVKSSVSNYNNGKLVGFINEFFPNGKPYLVKDPAKEPFSDDKIIANYDSLGKQLVTTGNGYCKLYDEDFKVLTAEGAVKEGKKDGIWHFRNDGATRVETYAQGTFLEGTHTTAEGEIVKYTKRESPPEFRGGVQGFTRFLEKSIKYPKLERKNNIQGKVFVSFVVERNGTITDVTVVRTPNEALGNEASRVLKLSPPWSPGIQYGRPVRVQYTVPINFSLGAGSN